MTEPFAPDFRAAPYLVGRRRTGRARDRVAEGGGDRHRRRRLCRALGRTDIAPARTCAGGAGRRADRLRRQLAQRRHGLGRPQDGDRRPGEDARRGAGARRGRRGGGVVPVHRGTDRARGDRLRLRALRAVPGRLDAGALPGAGGEGGLDRRGDRAAGGNAAAHAAARGAGLGPLFRRHEGSGDRLAAPGQIRARAGRCGGAGRRHAGRAGSRNQHRAQRLGRADRHRQGRVARRRGAGRDQRLFPHAGAGQRHALAGTAAGAGRQLHHRHRKTRQGADKKTVPESAHGRRHQAGAELFPAEPGRGAGAVGRTRQLPLRRRAGGRRGAGAVPHDDDGVPGIARR